MECGARTNDFLYGGRRMTFSDFGFSTELLRAVRAKNYTVPTPIQEKAIPHVLSGKDLLGGAQTGTGKTAALPPSTEGSARRRRSGRGGKAWTLSWPPRAGSST